MLREGFIKQLKAAFEPWLDWTPTLSQPSALTVTVDYARYKVIGRAVFLEAHLSIGSAGTLATALVLGGLPQSIKQSGAQRMVGTAFYRVSGGTGYCLLAQAFSSTSVAFLEDAQTNYWGITPSVATASGDAIGIKLFYEF